MLTLRMPEWSQFSEEEQAFFTDAAKRQGISLERLMQPSVMGVQAHWPAWQAANRAELTQAYRVQGQLSQLTKEVMHTAVSMVNACDYWSDRPFGRRVAADIRKSSHGGSRGRGGAHGEFDHGVGGVSIGT